MMWYKMGDKYYKQDGTSATNHLEGPVDLGSRRAVLQRISRAGPPLSPPWHGPPVGYALSAKSAEQGDGMVEIIAIITQIN